MSLYNIPDILFNMHLLKLIVNIIIIIKCDSLW